MIRTAIIAILSVAAVVAVNMPVAAKSARTEAMKICSARTIEELGTGKIVKTRTKRLRSGYKVKFVKLDAAGEGQAKISCSVKAGEIVDYTVEGKTVLAR